ncbi:BTAD domain-containing putative transcriptional regulator [Actinomadura sp. 1N219]|uniref:AfsR/SARP family transcriptional regulator n=1 Tax=Actinomadura sp. 1N219 TaxID=3375152 RepID=UPI0037ADD0FC
MLGGLEIRVSGEQVALTPPKQRAILAALLLDVNHEVPISRLSRFIWDDRPPATAQTTLQSYIYRLRQFLRPLAVELKTSNDCYVLEVRPAEIDLWHFRQRVREAREKTHDGRLDESVAEYRSALALWRGGALSAIPGELVRQEARLLEAERIAAYEELFTAEIRLGNHRQIIPELQKVVTAHPFHESLTALLMLALYSSARQAEALQHYRQVRRRLRDDLGIEPGQELQELHQSVLEQQPAEEIVAARYGTRRPSEVA